MEKNFFSLFSSANDSISSSHHFYVHSLPVNMFADFPFLGSRPFVTDRHHASRGLRNLSLTSSRNLSASYDKLNAMDTGVRPLRSHGTCFDLTSVGVSNRSLHTRSFSPAGRSFVRIRDVAAPPPPSDSRSRMRNSSVPRPLPSSNATWSPYSSGSESTYATVSKPQSSYAMDRRDVLVQNMSRPRGRAPLRSPRLPYGNHHQLPRDSWKPMVNHYTRPQIRERPMLSSISNSIALRRSRYTPPVFPKSNETLAKLTRFRNVIKFQENNIGTPLTERKASITWDLSGLQNGTNFVLDPGVCNEEELPEIKEPEAEATEDENLDHQEDLASLSQEACIEKDVENDEAGQEVKAETVVTEDEKLETMIDSLEKTENILEEKEVGRKSGKRIRNRQQSNKENQGVTEVTQIMTSPPAQANCMARERRVSNAKSSKGISEFKWPKKVAPAVDEKTGKIRFRKYTMDDFKFLKVLGRGSFGKVFLAELKPYKRYFAVKCLKKLAVIEDDDVESTMIERQILAMGHKNPFICNLFCTFQTQHHLNFVMEYLSGGDLMFHVQRNGRFPEDRARFYAAEIVCALKFLHQKFIIYRDLKLDNVLLDSDGHVRLVDFGMCQCRTYRNECLPSNFCGTPEYMAPEIIKGVQYNQAVDWWSLGVLIYEMLTGRSPFTGADEDELLWNICYDKVFYPLYLSEAGKSIIQLLLERESEKRLGLCRQLGDVTQQNFFHGIDWTRAEQKKLVPPFVPSLESSDDTKYFDEDFTTCVVNLTPVDNDLNTPLAEELFTGFSYTNPNLVC